MNNLLQFIYATFGNCHLLFIIECLAILFKSYLLFYVIRFMSRKGLQKTAFFLMLALMGTLIDDIAWLTKIIQLLFIPTLSYTFITFIIRIAWIMVPITWQSLSLFLETLAEPYKKFAFHQKFFSVITAGITIFYINFMITNFYVANAAAKTSFEYAVMQYSLPYCIFVLLLSVFIVLYKINTKQIPRIVKKQLLMLIKLIALPLFCIEMYHIAYPTGFIPTNITASYSIIMLATIVISFS